MKRSLRTVVCVALCAVLLFSLSVVSVAATFNAEEEKNALSAALFDGITPENAKQVLLYYSVFPVGSIRRLFISEKDVWDVWDDSLSDALNYASAILISLSMGQDPTAPCHDGKDPVGALSALQQQDGSFGDLSVTDTVYVMTALRSAQMFLSDGTKVYSDAGAAAYLLSLQNEDGSFGDVKTTAAVISYLSCFKDEKTVNEALTRAVNTYLVGAQTENGGFADRDISVLASVICALTDAGEDLMTGTWYNMPRLLEDYKNEDGTYRRTPDGEHTADEEAMLDALAAFDAKLSGQSYTHKLMTHGTYFKSIWKNIREAVLVYAALAVLALVFWGYMLFGRKKAADKPKGDDYEAH